MLLSPLAGGQVKAAATVSPARAAAKSAAKKVVAAKPAGPAAAAAPAKKAPAKKPAALGTVATTLPQFMRDPAYVAAKNSASLNLGDYDAETLRGRQATQIDQGYQGQLLQQQTQDARTANADDFAARGIERSGVQLQGQDKIGASALQSQNAIDQSLTDYNSQRSQGRLAQTAKNRTGLDSVLQKLQTSFYNAQRKAS